MTKYIYYHKDIDGVSDAYAEAAAAKLIEEMSIATSNSLVIDCVRYLIVTEVITEPVILNVNGAEYPFNEYGVNHDIPLSIYYDSSISEKILRAQLKVKRSKDKRLGLDK